MTDLKEGDHVLPVFTGECGECRHCKSEESNMCDLLRINTDRGVMISDGNTRFSKNGQPIYHFVGTSTFSEYTVVHVGCLAKINPCAPLDIVCVLSCGISTGLGATLNVAKPTKGSSVAIFGLGAVGLAVCIFIFNFSFLFHFQVYVIDLIYISFSSNYRLLRVQELPGHLESLELISIQVDLKKVIKTHP